jgi:DNA-binding MarR family transcriptional regulator
MNVVTRTETSFRAVPMIIAAARESEMSMRMLAILACAAEQPGLSVKHVAARLGIPKPCVSRSLDQLVASDLVERLGNPADRRQIRVFPTDSGHALLRRIGAASAA